MPSPLSYFASRAGQAIDQAADALNQARIALSAATRRSTTVLRQEVPFERWFFDYGCQTPLEGLTAQVKARGWATLAVAEGSVRTIAEAVCFLFSKVFEPCHSARHFEVLKAQWTGLRLSLLAVASPNTAKQEADNNGSPIIGTLFLDWRWGTLYTGKLDISPWRIECSQYPWAGQTT